MISHWRLGLPVFFLLPAVLLFPAAAEPPASAYFTLDNGLQVLLQEKHDLPLTGMALAIDLGTKDESEATSGYAHLFEHMLLFGSGGGAGTADSEARLAELRRHGVAHNAHTDHDLMTFEVSCPAAESAWALERMRQAVFSGQLDPRLLESEKRVISEEILQLRDDPAFLGRLLVMEQLFAGHPYGQPVYGDGRAIPAPRSRGCGRFARRGWFRAIARYRSSAISRWPRWRNTCAAAGEDWPGSRPRRRCAAGGAPGKKQRAPDPPGYPGKPPLHRLARPLISTTSSAWPSAC